MTSHSRSHRPSKGHASHSGKDFSRGPRKANKTATVEKNEHVSRTAGSGANLKNPGSCVPHSPQPAALSDPDRMRLNKAIAASGLCLRRKADELILSGRVTVNGIAEPNPARQVSPEEPSALTSVRLPWRRTFTTSSQQASQECGHRN